jgi:hypothetical protein
MVAVEFDDGRIALARPEFLEAAGPHAFNFRAMSVFWGLSGKRASKVADFGLPRPLQQALAS